jgi:prepilin-type N-terminal cleavage/methylation domain-containing protein
MKSSTKRSVNGFTLIEVLIAVSILAFCLCGLLATYVNMFFLTSLLRDSILATNAVQAKMEEVRNAGFNCASRCEFPIEGITESKGVVEVDTVTGYANLQKVSIFACFRSRGRVIGNDIDNCSSSPVEAVTFVYR